MLNFRPWRQKKSQSKTLSGVDFCWHKRVLLERLRKGFLSYKEGSEFAIGNVDLATKLSQRYKPSHPGIQLTKIGNSAKIPRVVVRGRNSSFRVSAQNLHKVRVSWRMWHKVRFLRNRSNWHLYLINFSNYQFFWKLTNTDLKFFSSSTFFVFHTPTCLSCSFLASSYSFEG